MITKEKIKERFEMSEDFSIPARTANILKREKVETFLELISLTEDDVKNFKGSGQKTANELKSFLSCHGLALTPFTVKKLSFAELNTLNLLINLHLDESREVLNG